VKCEVFWGDQDCTEFDTVLCVSVCHWLLSVEKRKFFGVRNGLTQQMKLMLEIIGDDLYGEWDGITHSTQPPQI
jgi:hypothetical protein